MTAHPKGTTRETDELHLAWLRLRCDGHSTGQIAKAYGTRPAAVRVATNRILDADTAENGERVRYWRTA